MPKDRSFFWVPIWDVWRWRISLQSHHWHLTGSFSAMKLFVYLMATDFLLADFTPCNFTKLSYQFQQSHSKVFWFPCMENHVSHKQEKLDFLLSNLYSLIFFYMPNDSVKICFNLPKVSIPSKILQTDTASVLSFILKPGMV